MKRQAGSNKMALKIYKLWLAGSISKPAWIKPTKAYKEATR